MEHLETLNKFIDNLGQYRNYLIDRLDSDEEFDNETLFDELQNILTDLYYGN